MRQSAVLQITCSCTTNSVRNTTNKGQNVQRSRIWTKDAFQNTKQVLNLAQVKELFSLARQYNISIVADLNGHIGTAWEIPHIHLGDARIHVAVAKEAIEWIINNLS